MSEELDNAIGTITAAAGRAEELAAVERGRARPPAGDREAGHEAARRAVWRSTRSAGWRMAAVTAGNDKGRDNERDEDVQEVQVDVTGLDRLEKASATARTKRAIGR